MTHATPATPKNTTEVLIGSPAPPDPHLRGEKEAFLGGGGHSREVGQTKIASPSNRSDESSESIVILHRCGKRPKISMISSA